MSEGAEFFEFICTICGEAHRGMPAFGLEAPLSYYAVPKDERASRCELTNDACIVDKQAYFVRGCIEIPVRGESEPFSWGVWVSLSQVSYRKWEACFSEQKRAHIGPFFGWLDVALRPYPDTTSLKTMVHLRDDGMRPYIELEPTEHPLAVEQRKGISVARVAEIFSLMTHDDAK